MAKIYTKTGDSGQTGLIGGTRVPKNHIRVEAYGTVDEANAHIGLVLSRLTDRALRQELTQIQGMLFELGAILADPQARHHRPDGSDVHLLEHAIDRMTDILPALTSFILPGGTEVAATIHIARTEVRRAERRVVTLGQHQEVPLMAITYLNRLSDYLFVLARFVNAAHNVADTAWHSLEKPTTPSPA